MTTDAKIYSWNETCSYLSNKILRFKNNSIDYYCILWAPRRKNSAEDREYLRIAKFLDEIAEALYPHIGKYFSAGYIRDRFWRDILEALLLENSTPSRELLHDYFERIKSEHDTFNGKSCIFFPVTNIIVKSDTPIHLKGLEFCKLSKLSIDERYIHEPTRKDLQSFVQTVVKISLAQEIGKTYDDGKRMVKGILDAFQFCDFYDHTRKNICPYKLWKRSKLFDRLILTENEDSKLEPYRIARHYSMGRIFLPLTSEQERSLQKKHFDFVYEVLIKDWKDLSTIEQVIRHAISWYIKGEQTESDEIALIAYTCALETVFKCGKGHSTHIARGLYHILSPIYRDKIDIKKRTRELYDVRSSLLHGSFSQTVCGIQAEDTRFCANQAIHFLIDHFDDFQGKSRDHIIKYFKDIERQ